MSEDASAPMASERGRHRAPAETPDWMNVAPGVFSVGPRRGTPEVLERPRTGGTSRGSARLALAGGAGVLVVLTALLVVVIALGFAAVSGARETRSAALPTVGPVSASASPLSTGTPAVSPPGQGAVEPDWAVVIARLDAARGQVLMSGTAPDLAGFDARNSPAWRADEAALTRLLVGRLRPSGLATDLITVKRWRVPSEAAGESAALPADSVVLRVVERRKAYRLLDQSGGLAERVAAGPKRRWLVTVVPALSAEPTDPGWRIWRVGVG